MERNLSLTQTSDVTYALGDIHDVSHWHVSISIQNTFAQVKQG